MVKPAFELADRPAGFPTPRCSDLIQIMAPDIRIFFFIQQVQILADLPAGPILGLGNFFLCDGILGDADKVIGLPAGSIF